MNQKRTAQAFVPLRRVTPVAAALAAVASCQVETRSITGVPRTGRPVAVVASPTTAAISPTDLRRIRARLCIRKRSFLWRAPRRPNGVIPPAGASAPGEVR